MLIWQRQCRLPRLCYVYTRGMNYYMTVYLLFALQAGTYTLKIKFGEIK